GVESDPWSDQETGEALSSEATLQDHDWMEEPVADLFGDEPVSSTPDPLGGSAAPLFGDLAGEPADPDPEVDTEDPPSVAAMLDDFFSGDSLTDEPPAPAQAIAKPIGSGFISDSLDESESSDESTSLFEQFEQPDGEDDGALLFVESLESESLDSLQDHISDFGSEFIADSFDESDSSEEAASLFDQFEQPVDPPDAEEDGVSLFAESSEDFPLDLLQDEMGAPSGDDGFSSLLEGLQEEDGASGALTDAEEAKTLADLLRSQKAYFVQPAAAPESDESRAVPPAVPSDSDPFSNWFGSDGEDAEETRDAQKKNNG
ncbi:MAG: hypothetical protein VKJ64_20240, partial [Leptolyngbyaceae bacterium]|nr:hypothetical protein [Leptolyngbyaceae bacterium]